MRRLKAILPSKNEENKVPEETQHVLPTATLSETAAIYIPKPNLQVILLGMVALITIFQTIQLFRLAGRLSTTGVKISAPSSGGTNSSQTGSGDAPASMVGGC